MSEALKGMREKRAQLIEDASAILTAAEGRMSAEDSAKFDAIHADVEAIKSDIVRHETQEQAKADLALVQDEKREEKQEQKNERSEDEVAELRQEAFRNWLLTGTKAAPDAEAVQRASEVGINLQSNQLDFNLRAMGVGEATKGEKAVPEGFRNELEVALLAHGGMREAATILRTASGQKLPMPTSDDTGVSGRLIGESTQVTATDVTISEVILDAYLYSSDVVLVSLELMQDQAINLESYLGKALGTRLARITNNHFTVGTGSSQPNGIITAGTSGVTAAATGAVTYGELVDLVHSVDPDYRKGATLMFSDATLAALKKLVDGDNRPLWQPGITSEAPDKLLGYNYVVNQDVPDMATGTKSIVFGDLSKYIIREVTGVEMLRLNERYADFHQVAFLAYWRGDGDLLDAGTNPVKFITMA